MEMGGGGTSKLPPPPKKIDYTELISGNLTSIFNSCVQGKF